jgi:hypothetical protein
MQRDQAHRTNELLERIAKALEKDVKYKVKDNQLVPDIPGFEGTLDKLDDLCKGGCPCASCEENPTTTWSNKELHEQKLHTDDGYQDDDHIHNDYLNDLVTDMNQIEYSNFHRDLSCCFAQNDATEMTNFISELEYEECLGAIKTALHIKGNYDYLSTVECSGFNEERKDELAREYVIDLVKKENTTQPKNDPYTYDNFLRECVDGIVNDSDHDIRSAAKFYEAEYLDKEGATKKECILDYVTNEFGILGARYTDIIKFAYYLGAHNTLKYTSEDRGYYACAFATRFGGHLVQGGEDQLVKGINKEGKERYFALSMVDNFTDYYKRIS